jgi:hypothetical protein
VKFDCDTRAKAKESGARWFPYQKGGDFRKWFGNNEFLAPIIHDAIGFERGER